MPDMSAGPICWARHALNFKVTTTESRQALLASLFWVKLIHLTFTNLVIVVVRYFGGIKLGTSGLIVAYREAAREAIIAGEIIECHEMREITFTFPYLSMNDVMKCIKDAGVKVLAQEFDNACSMTISIRADNAVAFSARISDIDGTSIV